MLVMRMTNIIVAVAVLYCWFKRSSACVGP
jgi:hypothetical protein